MNRLLLSRGSARLLLAVLLAGGEAGYPAATCATDPASTLAFHAAADGTIRFDTGTVRGRLGTDKLAFGIHELQWTATGQTLSGRYGLCNVYRVFSDGQRYGDAGWNWPHKTRCFPDGSVTVSCAAAADRPFALTGTYRWTGPVTLDLQIQVTPQQDLHGFEVFLASYFDASFDQAAVYVQDHPDRPGQPGFLRAAQPLGNWLMFPRDQAAVQLIQDGRWKLPPNPVDWQILPRWDRPLATRRISGNGLTSLLMAPRSDCFAIAMPYETEPHGSVYLSLFGRDLVAGRSASARARLQFLESADASAPVRAFAEYERAAAAEQ